MMMRCKSSPPGGREPADAGVRGFSQPSYQPHISWSHGRGTLVVGLGNDIGADDGVGIHAARRVAAAIGEVRGIEIVEQAWGGMPLLELLRGYDRAILLDSLRTGLHAPGTVVELSESDFAGSVRLNSFHDLNFSTAMALGRALGWILPSQIWIYAVEGREFDHFDTALTPPVATALDEVVRCVMHRLSQGE